MLLPILFLSVLLTALVGLGLLLVARRRQAAQPKPVRVRAHREY